MSLPLPILWLASILLTVFLMAPSEKQVAKQEALQQQVDQLRVELTLARQ